MKVTVMNESYSYEWKLELWMKASYEWKLELWMIVIVMNES